MGKNIDSEYWNNYYASHKNKNIPSQFAAFVLSEFNDRSRFIDCGCGNGRDSFFFAEHGKNVFGVDGSPVTIENCQEEAREKNELTLKFEQLDFSEPQNLHKFTDHHKSDWENCVIYARFFLHAINEELEKNFFDFCSNLMGSRGVICIEFRTDKDEALQKETDLHYRRFIDPIKFIERIKEFGLTVDYFVEGMGYAKYRSDDAYVARMIIGRK